MALHPFVPLPVPVPDGPRADPAAPVCVQVDSELDVSRVVNTARRFCADNDLPVLLAAHVATAASELANNLWMHASGGGRISLALLDGPGRRGVELVAQDLGPGIADLPLAMTEGYSSAGGLGCGLTGVQRLMDDFRIDSSPEHGTRVTARKFVAHDTFLRKFQADRD